MASKTFKVPTIFTAIDQVSRVSKAMGTSIRNFAVKAEVNLARVDRGFRRLMSPITKARRALGSFGIAFGATALIMAGSNGLGVIQDYEQANAGLAAVMGKTVEQNKALMTDSKRLGSVTAKTASEVVGLQESYARLGFQQNEILDMTEATIHGSVAMRGELAATAELVGAMVRTFDKFSSTDAPQIIDQMTFATQRSALNFEKLQTSLPIVAGAAEAAGIPFTTLTALLGKLSDAGIDASSSATALRNIFIESRKKGLNYSQILKLIQKDQDKLTAATDIYGKRAAVSATILANKLSEVQQLDLAIQTESTDAAFIAQAKQLNTITGRLTILTSAYEGWILSVDSGNGTMSRYLKNSIEVVTELFAMASGTQRAREELNKHELKVRSFAETMGFWLKFIVGVIGAFVAFKGILMSTMFVIKLYRGVMAAWALITGQTTMAQLALNTAMMLNPIGIIVAAVIALIAVIAVAINKYHEWGAALLLFMGPLGFIINAIQSFRRNWEMITQAFKTGGIVEGLKAIGVTLLDAVLMPLQQLLDLISKVPGTIGNYAGMGAEKILQIRENLGVNTTTDEAGKELIDNKVTAEKLRTERQENIEKQKLDINILDPGRNAEISKFPGLDNIDVNLGSTSGY